MVEQQEQHSNTTTSQTHQEQQKPHAHKQVTLAYDAGKVLPFDTPLEHKYAVWAMVKNPQHHHGQQ